MKKNYFFTLLFSVLFFIHASENFAQTPANDDCSGAITITPASMQGVCNVTAVNTTNATQSTDVISCSTQSYDDDVWYKFVANDTAMTVKAGNKSFTGGIGFTAYEDACGGTQTTECVTNAGGDSLNFFNLVVGKTYYLRTFTQGTTNRGTYDLCIYPFVPPPPPANDSCVNAVNLTVASDTTCNGISGLLTYASQEYAPDSCSGNTSGAAYDLWYKFTATQTALTVRATSADVGLAVMVYNSCGGTVIACGNPALIFGFATPGTTSVNTTGLTVGNTYYVRVYNYGNAAPANGNFTICVLTPPPPPANDACVNAVNLTVASDTTCNGISGLLTYASQEYPSDSCSGNTSGAAYDLWYKFTATQTALTVRATSADVGLAVMVYNSCGGTVIACGNPALIFGFATPGTTSVNTTGLTVGNTYYVRVYNYGNAAPANGNFTICVFTPPPPPSNDLCSTAINITASSDTTCNSTAGTLVSANQESAPVFCDIEQSPAAYDVWYKFTATGTSHSVLATSADVGLVVLVYDTCGGNVVGCGNPNIFFGNAFPGTTRADLTGLTSGKKYFVRIYNYGSNVPALASFDICVITPPPPPSNDNCSGAIMITAANNQSQCTTTTVNTFGATQSNPAPSCDFFGSSDDDVWYYFIATDTLMTVSAQNYLGGIATFGATIYESSCIGIEDAADCSAFSDGDSITFHSLTAGTEYYMQIFSSETGIQGTFDICVYGYTQGNGIRENILENSLSVSPNPTNQLLNIHFNIQSSSVEMKLMNIKGQLIFKQSLLQYNGSYNDHIDMGQLSEGVYILQITTEKGTVIKKIVKE